MAGLEFVSLVVLAAWVLLLSDRTRRWPEDHFLTGSGDVAHVEPVAAVVPARDEASLIPETLPSLLRQRNVDLSVYLVNDGSSDGTVEVALEAAARCGCSERLHIVHAEPTPPGWSGKVHALHCGVRAVSAMGSGSMDRAPEWVLFTDADIRHRGASVATLLDRAKRESGNGPFDLVSIMARLHAGVFWERLLIPPFVFFFQLLYPFRRVSRFESKVAAAAGGCVLIRREVLKRSGGLEAIRGALIDDVALAAQIKKAGGRIWLGFDAGVESLRAYPRLSDLWRMVARTAFTQLGHRMTLLVITIAALALFVASPPFLIGYSALTLEQSLTSSSFASVRALVFAAGAWALQFGALLPSVRHHRASAPWALGLPLAAVLYGLMTLASAWYHLVGRSAEWRGRIYEAP